MTYLLNKYVFNIRYDKDNIILYNSMNGVVLLVSNTEFLSGFNIMPDSDRKKMATLGFFKNDTECLQEITNTYLNPPNNELDIIIEFTQRCNLRCPYCYQSTWGRKNRITSASLDKLFAYIKKCYTNKKFSSLRLSLFGGEPLLERAKIMYIYTKIRDFCREHEIVLRTFLTTNATLLTNDFVEMFDNLIISITLSGKKDHNTKRQLGNTPSYDIVVQNIKNLTKILDFERYKLSIRYNTDDTNIAEFKNFVKIISHMDRRIVIDIAYLEEFESSNNYKNLLPFGEFKIWNSSTAIDILIKYGMRVDAAPKIIRYPCHGYSMYNIKLFANGYLGLCDASSPSATNLTIDQVFDNLNPVECLPVRKDIKLTMKECFRCRDFVLCGGRTFCKKKPCDYGLIDVSVFLKTYIKYALKGQAYLFSFHKSIERTQNESNKRNI